MTMFMMSIVVHKFGLRSFFARQILLYAFCEGLEVRLLHAALISETCFGQVSALPNSRVWAALSYLEIRFGIKIKRAVF